MQISMFISKARTKAYPKFFDKEIICRFSGLASVGGFLMLALVPIGYLEAQDREPTASVLDVRNRTHSEWSPLGVRGGGTSAPLS